MEMNEETFQEQETEAPEEQETVTEETVEEPEAEAQEPEPQDERYIPKERFDEINERARRAEEEARLLREHYLRTQQQTRQQEQQRYFDEETERGISSLVSREVAPLRQENLSLKTDMVMKELRSLPDWQTHERDIGEKLRAMGADKMDLSDVRTALEVAKTAYSAVLAEKGIYNKQAKQSAAVKAQQRAAARTPTKGAGRQKEQDVKYSEMNSEQKRAFIASLPDK